MAMTGNSASPLSPHEQDAGAVFKFSLYHLVDLDHREEFSLFPVAFHLVEKKQPCPNNALASLSKARFEELDKGELIPLSKSMCGPNLVTAADLLPIL
jgi:hypothetical protein